MKTAAYARAAEIAAQAEIRAAEIARSSEEVCKAYRETQLKAAEADAQKKYLAALAEKRAEAELKNNHWSVRAVLEQNQKKE